MLPDRVSNPGPLTYESGALPIAPTGPANSTRNWLSTQGANSLLLELPLIRREAKKENSRVVSH